MIDSFTSSVDMLQFSLWRKMELQQAMFDITLELTARCNLNCRHCYINQPPGDRAQKANELTFEEIDAWTDEAVDLGCLWCLLTGGEPLLREDFTDIYLLLKKKGLLVSVFTNAVLIKEEHLRLFRKYPPRELEVTVYGVTPETYGRVTLKPDTYKGFMRGVNQLLESGIKVRFKSMAMRSNLDEMPQIADFCRERTAGFFKFDPFLHLRYDSDPARNAEIISERLSPDEIVTLEHSDPDRIKALDKDCGYLNQTDLTHTDCNHLFHCGAGKSGVTISYDGRYRICSELWHPDAAYDLRKGSLTEAWRDFTPRIRDMRSDNPIYHQNCKNCAVFDLCFWCPAHAHLEHGRLDEPVGYFCEVAHARSDSLQRKLDSKFNLSPV